MYLMNFCSRFVESFTWPKKSGVHLGLIKASPFTFTVLNFKYYVFVSQTISILRVLNTIQIHKRSLITRNKGNNRVLMFRGDVTLIGMSTHSPIVAGKYIVINY